MTYDDYDLESGKGDEPSIEEMFTPETAPGLGANPKYVHASFSGGLDWRPSPGYARRGGLYEVTYHNYHDVNETYSFDRVDGEVVQHLPILSRHGSCHCTAGADHAARRRHRALLPDAVSGGWQHVAGVSERTYRDRHSLLMSGEVRWMPNRAALDMAIFYDLGKVASHWDGLSLDGLKSDVGIGVRFHSSPRDTSSGRTGARP